MIRLAGVKSAVGALAALRANASSSRHKFHASPIVVDGIRFSSTREAHRYRELRVLEAAGQIRDVELQPVFNLHARNPVTGSVMKIGQYRGDFGYITVATGASVIEDVKGVRLALYLWKKKHVKAEYGIDVCEV